MSLVRIQQNFDDHYAVLTGLEAASPASLCLGADAGLIGFEVEIFSDLMKYVLSQVAGEENLVWSRFLTQPSQFRDSSPAATAKLITDKRQSVNVMKNDTYVAYRFKGAKNKKNAATTKATTKKIKP